MSRNHVMLYSKVADKSKIESLRTCNKYDPIQERTILDAINLQPYSELEKFSISKMRLKKIEKRKEKLGNFASLDEIVELDGFGEKVLEKLCDSILMNENNSSPIEPEVLVSQKPAEEPEKIHQKRESYCSPVLLQNFRTNIRSIVAIQADLRYISWTKLSLGDDNKSIVTNDWNSVQVGDEDKKLNLTDLIQLMLNISGKIPKADVYVLEALQAPQAAKQPGNILQVNVNIQRSQLIAMIATLMATRNLKMPEIEEPDQGDRKSQQQHVFFLKNFLASRLYRIFIGNERVSCEHVMNEIFQQISMGNEEVEIPFEFRELYKEESRMSREYLGQSMIIGLTFLKLCVRRCEESINKLNSRKFNRNEE